MPNPLGVMALPSQLPFKGVGIFNLITSLFLIFIAGNVMERDKRGDWEVLFVRPASNLSWVAGKVMAVLAIVGMVEILALLVLGLLFVNDVALCPDIYLFYIFTWSFPMCVFWIGCIALVSRWIVARGIRTILLLIIWGVLFFYSSSWGYGIGDFMVRQMPNLFSDAVGHAGIGFYLLHRTCYFLLGSACLLLAVGGFCRIDNDRRMKFVVSIVGIVLLLGGIGIAWIFVNEHREDILKREIYRASLSKYRDAPRVHVIQHDIAYRQENDSVFGKSNLRIEGAETMDMSKIIMFLNPGLYVREVRVEGENVPFYREGMSVILERGIRQKEKCRVEMVYAGRIEDAACYLDQPDEDWNSYRIAFTSPWVTTNDMYRFGGWCAKVSDKYTLLHPEIGWYPSAVPFVNPELPLARELDFTRYTLNVERLSNRKVISQGKKKKIGNDVIFDTRVPLSGISLCMGDYECVRVEIDSLEIEFYCFPGHDCWTTGWQFSEKERMAVIRGVREILEEKYGSSFIFNPFRIVEVPESFTLKRRAWREETNAVQPGLMFLEERGINRAGKKVLDFFRGIPLEARDETYWYNLIRHVANYMNEGTGSFRPLFEDLAGGVSDSYYPGISLILRQMLTYGQLIVDENVNRNNVLDIQVVDYLDYHSFRDALRDVELSPDLLQHMIYLMSGDLLASWSAEIGTDSLRIFLSDFFRECRYRNIQVHQLKERLQACFGGDLGRRIDTLYDRRGLPQYRFENVVCERVDENKIRMAASVVNEGNSEGVLSIVRTQFDGRNVNSCFDAFRFQRGEKKCCEWYAHVPIIPDKLEIKTHLSKHLPLNITVSLKEKIDTTGIIVDNEDKEFCIIEKKGNRKLSSLFDEKSIKKTYVMNDLQLLTDNWQWYVAQNCYGDRVKSAIAKSEGNGASRVVWNATLLSAGRYELEVYIPNAGWNRNRSEQMVYFYRIVQQEKIENVSLDWREQEWGWLSLGEFECENGEIAVELSDKVGGTKMQNGDVRVVIADAIRWKKIESNKGDVPKVILFQENSSVTSCHLLYKQRRNW